MMPPDWTVLLIGGPPGSGKTIAAAGVARILGVSHLLVDDLRLAIQRVTTPAQLPTFRALQMSGADASPTPEDRCEWMWRAGEAIAPAIDSVVRHHIEINLPAVIEGDGILPAFAAHLVADLSLLGKARAAMLSEPNERVLFDHLHARASRVEDDPVQAMTQARGNWLFGEGVDAEARRYGLPLIPSRPLETLAERVLGAASIAPAVTTPEQPAGTAAAGFEVWNTALNVLISVCKDEESALALVRDAIWTYGVDYVRSSLRMARSNQGGTVLEGAALVERALDEMRA